MLYNNISYIYAVKEIINLFDWNLRPDWVITNIDTPEIRSWHPEYLIISMFYTKTMFGVGVLTD